MKNGEESTITLSNKLLILQLYLFIIVGAALYMLSVIDNENHITRNYTSD